MQILTIPVRADNYAYLIIEGQVASCVDPGEAGPILAALEKHALKLDTVCITHSHMDHTAGLGALRKVTDFRLVAPADLRQPDIAHSLSDNDEIMLGQTRFTALSTPGHCQNHFALFAPGVLFSGDVLFAGGCGRVLSGSAEQLWHSLQRLMALPDDTQVYCGHDYTEDNLRFALDLLPHDTAIQAHLHRALERRAEGAPTVPTLLGDERQANIFLRSAETAVADAVGHPGAPALEVFAALRKRKDRW